MKKFILSLLVTVFASGLFNTLTAGYIYTIDAPLPGTFYRNDDLSQPPLVTEGDVVFPGRLVCFIEAMKMLIGIESSVSGMIVSIECSNFQYVETGQIMFIIWQ